MIESLRAAVAVEVYVAQDPADPLVGMVPRRSSSVTGPRCVDGVSRPVLCYPAGERTAKTIARFLEHRGVQMPGDNVAAGAALPPSDAAVSGVTSAPALAALAAMQQMLAESNLGKAGD